MTLPPRTPTMREALEQIASLIQSLPRSATADQIHAVARAALAAEESGLSCAKCGEWLGDGRAIMWEPKTSRCYCIGHEPRLPPPPAAKEPR